MASSFEEQSSADTSIHFGDTKEMEQSSENVLEKEMSGIESSEDGGPTISVGSQAKQPTEFQHHAVEVGEPPAGSAFHVVKHADSRKDAELVDSSNEQSKDEESSIVKENIVEVSEWHPECSVGKMAKHFVAHILEQHTQEEKDTNSYKVSDAWPGLTDLDNAGDENELLGINKNTGDTVLDLEDVDEAIEEALLADGNDEDSCSKERTRIMNEDMDISSMSNSQHGTDFQFLKPSMLNSDAKDSSLAGDGNKSTNDVGMDLEDIDEAVENVMLAGGEDEDSCSKERTKIMNEGIDISEMSDSKHDSDFQFLKPPILDSGTKENDVESELQKQHNMPVHKPEIVYDIDEETRMGLDQTPVDSTLGEASFIYPSLPPKKLFHIDDKDSEPSDSETKLSIMTETEEICLRNIISIDDATKDSAASDSNMETPTSSRKQRRASREGLGISLIEGLEARERIFTAENLFEYQWPQDGGDWHMLQEQISEFLKVKSFKRKYPDLYRRTCDKEEKDFLREKGVVTETQSDLGLTALKSEEVYDLMTKDYNDKYKEYIAILQEKQKKVIHEKHKEYSAQAKLDKSKIDTYSKKAARSAAEFNANLMREKKDERRAYFDLQTYTIHFPKNKCRTLPPHMTKIGAYPVALISGQYQENFRRYTSEELRYYPVMTSLKDPPKPVKYVRPPPPGVKLPSAEKQKTLVGSEGEESEESSAEETGANQERNDVGENEDKEYMEGHMEESETQTPIKIEKEKKPKSSSKKKVSVLKASSPDRPKKVKKNKEVEEKSDDKSSQDGEDKGTGSDSKKMPGKIHGLEKCRICKKRSTKEERKNDMLVKCAECGKIGHMGCLDLTEELVAVIKTYPWQCMECKTCVECLDPYDEDKMMFCDRCDRGYHTFCIGLDALPTGHWECKSCEGCPRIIPKSKTKKTAIEEPAEVSSLKIKDEPQIKQEDEVNADEAQQTGQRSLQEEQTSSAVSIQESEEAPDAEAFATEREESAANSEAVAQMKPERRGRKRKNTDVTPKSKTEKPKTPRQDRIQGARQSKRLKLKEEDEDERRKQDGEEKKNKKKKRKKHEGEGMTQEDSEKFRSEEGVSLDDFRDIVSEGVDDSAVTLFDKNDDEEKDMDVDRLALEEVESVNIAAISDVGLTDMEDPPSPNHSSDEIDLASVINAVSVLSGGHNACPTDDNNSGSSGSCKTSTQLEQQLLVTARGEMPPPPHLDRITHISGSSEQLNPSQSQGKEQWSTFLPPTRSTGEPRQERSILLALSAEFGIPCESVASLPYQSKSAQPSSSLQTLSGYPQKSSNCNLGQGAPKDVFTVPVQKQVSQEAYPATVSAGLASTVASGVTGKMSNEACTLLISQRKSEGLTRPRDLEMPTGVSVGQQGYLGSDQPQLEGHSTSVQAVLQMSTSQRVPIVQGNSKVEMCFGQGNSLGQEAGQFHQEVATNSREMPPGDGLPEGHILPSEPKSPEVPSGQTRMYRSSATSESTNEVPKSRKKRSRSSSPTRGPRQLTSGMPKKRSHSRSSGVSVHATPSTQVDVRRLERELLSCGQEELANRSRQRSSDAHSRPLSSTESPSHAAASPGISRPGGRAKGHRTPSSRRFTLSSDSTIPQRKPHCSSDDLNENAAYSQRFSRRKIYRCPRGRPRKKIPSSQFLRIPVDSVIFSSEIKLHRPHPRYSRRSRSRHKKETHRSSSSTLSRYSNNSSLTSPGKRRKKPRRSKSKQHSDSEASSRYRVTPCPTDGACSGHKKRPRSRVRTQPSATLSQTSDSHKTAIHATYRTRLGNTSRPRNRSYSNSSEHRRRRSSARASKRRASTIQIRRGTPAQKEKGQRLATVKRRRSSSSEGCNTRNSSCLTADDSLRRARRRSHSGRKRRRSTSASSAETKARNRYTLKAAEKAKSLLRRVSQVWTNAEPKAHSSNTEPSTSSKKEHSGKRDKRKRRESRSRSRNKRYCSREEREKRRSPLMCLIM